jgi:hypothetical protein
VNHLRIIILVLLSILLPIRGAMAATMLCPDGEETSTATMVVGMEDHGMQTDHQMHADHSTAHHHASDEASDVDTSSADHPPTCHLCASGCCMASIVGTVPSLGEPNLTALFVFPALTARVPAFQSDGQERPPRTI